MNNHEIKKWRKEKNKKKPCIAHEIAKEEKEKAIKINPIIPHQPKF